jgi:hypothetical protein
MNSTVKVKIYNRNIYTLDNIRHVPEFRRNLISLDRMDSLGCRYSARYRVMKVTKDALVILKKEKKISKFCIS